MNVFQAIMVALIATCSSWWFSHVVTRTWLYPIWSGFLVGIVMGQPLEGMMLAAAINLPYVGFITAGGSMPGNAMFAGSVGTAFGLVSGLPVEQVMTISVILGSVAVMCWNAYMTINSVWVHMAEKYAAQGNLKMVRFFNYVPSFFVSFVLNGIPALLIVVYGKAVGDALAAMPQWIMDGFALVGGILPALGIGMLLNFMGQKKILPFFFLGFFLAKFLGLGTMAITIFGAIIAFIIYLFGEKKEKEVA